MCVETHDTARRGDQCSAIRQSQHVARLGQDRQIHLEARAAVARSRAQDRTGSLQGPRPPTIWKDIEGHEALQGSLRHARKAGVEASEDR